jgi:hypothetical protein
MNFDGDTLEPLDVDERDDIAFRFAKALRAGETISSATVDVGVNSGTDSTPAAILVDAHQVSGSDVLQRVACHLPDDDVVYWMRCVATLNSGRKVTIYGRLRIVRLQ